MTILISWGGGGWLSKIGQVEDRLGDFSLHVILCSSVFLNYVNALPNENFDLVIN